MSESYSGYVCLIKESYFSQTFKWIISTEIISTNAQSTENYDKENKRRNEMLDCDYVESMKWKKAKELFCTMRIKAN